MFDRLVSRLARSVLFWDLLITLLTLQLASTIRIRFELGNELPNTSVQLPWQLYAAVTAIWFIVFMLLVPQRAIFTDGLIAAIGRLVAAVSLSSLSFAGMLYLSVRNVSRLQFIYFALLDLALLVVFHLIVRAYILLRHQRSVERRVLIVGGGEHGVQLAQEFARRPWAGINVVGYASDEALDERFGTPLGTVEDTEELVSRHAIDEVIFALPSQRHDEIAAITLRLSQYPVMVHMVPQRARPFVRPHNRREPGRSSADQPARIGADRGTAAAQARVRHERQRGAAATAQPAAAADRHRRSSSNRRARFFSGRSASASTGGASR